MLTPVRLASWSRLRPRSWRKRRSVALMCIPWLTSALAERWTETNRLSVALAEQKQQDALHEANAYRDQMRSLYEVAYTLSTTMNYQSVLDTALTESRKLVPHTTALVLLSTGQPDELFVAAAYGLREGDQLKRLLLSDGRIGQALRAVADDHMASMSVGIPLSRMWVIVWSLSGLAAFVAGQKSREALAVVEQFLRETDLPPELRRKVQVVAAELARTVRIRTRHGQ